MSQPVHDLVELISLDPSLTLDIRYARRDNFLGRPVYDQARAFLQRPAAQALIQVHRSLKAQGYGLLVFDGYRPWSVTKLFWDEVTPQQRYFLADPIRGSRHNRGCAVDLTLVDLRSGCPLPMPSDFDEMTERAHLDYEGGTATQRRHRDLLKQAMVQGGFLSFAPEWWHYDHPEWPNYPILDLPFPRI